MAPTFGTVFQMAYAVEDLQASIEYWIRTVGGGPFFVTEHFDIVDTEYRGKPATLDIGIAVGYCGGVCIEFIKQNDSAPSVYNEGGGLCRGVHHVGVLVEDFDAEIARHLAAGYEIATQGRVGVGGRAAYLDTVADLGHMLELVEGTESAMGFFTMIEDAARDWDGKDPIRMTE